MSEREDDGPRTGLSRRRLLGLFGAGTAGVLAAGAAGGVIGHAAAVDPAASSGPAPDDAVPFSGRHQAGIVTPAQDRLHFVAFDVITDSRDELGEVLRAWTDAELGQYRSGDGWLLYDQLDETQLHALSDSITALTESVSQVAAAVAQQ